MQPLGLTVKDNEAYLNGHKITDLAKEYKTPLYVMDEKTIKNAITTYQENMKSDKYRFNLNLRPSYQITDRLLQIILKFIKMNTNYQ